MWSCVYRDQIGYGRVPASSAAVEGEFNKIKNIIFKNELGSIRVDRFLEDHIRILDGQMVLKQAKFFEIEVEQKTKEAKEKTGNEIGPVSQKDRINDESLKTQSSPTNPALDNNSTPACTQFSAKKNRGCSG